MFVKVTRSGPRRYVQLVESYRDEDGRVRKRTVANLGRLEKLSGGALQSVIRGLARLSGSEDLPEPCAAPALSFEPARALGDVWTLTELWNELGLSELRRVFRRTRHRIDVEALVRVMVLNRLCDPESKLGVLRWLETVALPGLGDLTVTHQQLLRAMDALEAHHEELQALVARLVRPLIDHELSVVFYDLTTIRVHGESRLEGDLRAHGRSKEGPIARQVMLGVVQSAEGLPLHHELFEGNTAEAGTLVPTFSRVLERFPGVRRLIVVADRGLLSLDNLEALEGLRLPGGQAVEFIVAVPGRRYGELAELIAPVHARWCEGATEPVTGELSWNGRRLVWSHDPVLARTARERRRARMAELEARAEQLTAKLDAQDAGHSARGRRLTDSGATARFYHEVLHSRLSRIVRVELDSELFSYHVDEQALARAEQLDGKLLLVTSTPELSPSEVVTRYKALADIERGFRVLKSEIEIAPVYHRLPERIRAHAAICFLALLLHRVMRMRLKAARTDTSPERALERLRRIQYHQVRLGDGEPLGGISSVSAEQSGLLQALKVSKPAASRQLALL